VKKSRAHVDGVSFINQEESVVEQASATALKPGQSKDYVPRPNEIVGQKIVKRSRGRPPKLAKVVKAEEKLPPDVEREVDGVDDAADGGLVIKPGLPGQAKLVPAKQDMMSELRMMAERQQEIFARLERDRKLMLYSQMDESRRIRSVQEEADSELLQLMEKIERSGKIKLIIKRKLRGRENEQSED
jgi:molybdenum-dependent DNA-binding transcriptional regulator ModE